VASKDMKVKVMDQMKATFHFRDPGNAETMWNLMLDGLTDTQAVVALDVCAKHHKSNFAPSPGQFRAMALGERTMLGTLLDSRKGVFFRDEEGRERYYHPSIKDAHGNSLRPPTQEELNRKSKLTPGGKPAAMAFVKGLAAKIQKQQDRKERKNA